MKATLLVGLWWIGFAYRATQVMTFTLCSQIFLRENIMLRFIVKQEGLVASEQLRGYESIKMLLCKVMDFGNEMMLFCSASPLLYTASNLLIRI